MANSPDIFCLGLMVKSLIADILCRYVGPVFRRSGIWFNSTYLLMQVITTDCLYYSGFKQSIITILRNLILKSLKHNLLLSIKNMF